jgi:hypothetical protein
VTVYSELLVIVYERPPDRRNARQQCYLGICRQDSSGLEFDMKMAAHDFKLAALQGSLFG